MKHETKRRLIEWFNIMIRKLLRWDDSKVHMQFINIETRKIQIARTEHIFDNREFRVIQLDIAKHQVAMKMMDHIMRKTEAIEYQIEPYMGFGQACTKITAKLKFIYP